MGIPIIPSGDAKYDDRVLPAEVWFTFWYVPYYPLKYLNGKLDKDFAGDQKWIMGLLSDIRRAGTFRNPVVVWNHHVNRGVKQPMWLLRAGSNRVWCAEQLKWQTVPAILSLDPKELDRPPAKLGDAMQIPTDGVQSMFPDGGKIWANKSGWGLLRAKKPEVTYADHVPTSDELASVVPPNHGATKMRNPLIEDHNANHP